MLFQLCTYIYLPHRLFSIGTWMQRKVFTMHHAYNIYLNGILSACEASSHVKVPEIPVYVEKAWLADNRISSHTKPLTSVLTLIRSLTLLYRTVLIFAISSHIECLYYYERPSAASERSLFNITEKSQYERPDPTRPGLKCFSEAHISATAGPIGLRSSLLGSPIPSTP